ncbi:hypothetical protein V2J09_010598 [Rumex salicifolius]
MFKYINKGHDCVTASIYTLLDEIKEYLNCRYISPHEAFWRLFCFAIHYRSIPVLRLCFHLLDEHDVLFHDDDPIDVVVQRPGVDDSMFLAWMEYNKNSEEARNLTYYQLPRFYVWKQDNKKWCKRSPKRGSTIGRIYHASPGSGERYYLRIMLNHVKGPTCYEDIRTVDGIVYPTFREACYALGLLDDEKEYIDGIMEASFWGSTHYLQNLFVMLLKSGSMTMPENVWESIWRVLSDDILAYQRRILRIKDLHLSDDQLRNYALVEIEKLLHKNGSSLKNFPSMPQPDQSLISHGLNKMIQENEIILQHLDSMPDAYGIY